MNARFHAMLVAIPVIAGSALCVSAAAFAQDRVIIQDRVIVRGPVAASILNDWAKDRQAAREARQYPYMNYDQGPIASASEATSACSGEIIGEMGQGASIIGTPSAVTMATGWEVSGSVSAAGQDAVPFVCSVRNGLVSGTLIQR